MNKYETLLIEIDQEVGELDAQLNEAIDTKSYSELDTINARIDELASARKTLKEKAANTERADTFLAQMGGAGASSQLPTNAQAKPFGTLRKGYEVNPATLTEDSAQTLFKALQNKQAVSVKAFSSVDSLLPPQLAAGVVAKVHESRIMDRLPVQTISAPSYEYLVHASNTGVPAPVGEGQVKPTVTLNVTSQIAYATKLAALFTISHESHSDYPTFTSYAHSDMFRELVDIENSALLNGPGGAGNIQGFTTTSGIFSYAYPTTSPPTLLDAIEMQIAVMRSGPALADPDLLVLHPNTWAAIRRSKDNYGRYLIQPDPTRGAVDSVWGVPVLVTTAQTAGNGLLLDTSKFGHVLVREGISVIAGTNLDDFARNLTSYVIEERVALAIERPAAVLNITGLPTA